MASMRNAALWPRSSWRARSESDTDYDKALVSITEETRILRISADDAYAEAISRDLVTGTSIQVQFTGPVMESYPVQAVALHLVILE
jgi:hypothetical protein